MISVERKRRARRQLAFAVDKLSFSSSLCPDENARKFLVRFRLRRSRRGESLMELRNSVSVERALILTCVRLGQIEFRLNRFGSVRSDLVS